MTDTNENTVPSVGDKGTIGRGRNAGEQAEVIAVNGTDELAVKLASGGFTVIKTTNFRAPEPATVTVAAVVQAVKAGTLADLLNSIEPGAGDELAPEFYPTSV